ncbi:hypothetical protein [Dyadobacter psychrophilus]|uniref:hypothetical protein n=1 Tax=Dyadobacter psychrophilus TaxID=651661 RepID=UPI0009E4368E|nr:hypothetical protein [Dyadobacter psychrophilus]
MLKSLCLILLTAFLICKATDVASLLLAKEKSSVVCDTGTCDNEKTEVEKINDDQLLISHSLHFDKYILSIPLKKTFSYSAGFQNEISLKLLSPPPELI